MAFYAKLILNASTDFTVKVESDREVKGVYYISTKSDDGHTSNYITAHYNGPIYWTEDNIYRIGSCSQFTIQGDEHVLKSTHGKHLVYNENGYTIVDESSTEQVLRLSNFDASAVVETREKESDDDDEYEERKRWWAGFRAGVAAVAKEKNNEDEDEDEDEYEDEDEDKENVGGQN